MIMVLVYYVIVVSKMKIHCAVFWKTDIVPCIDLMYSVFVQYKCTCIVHSLCQGRLSLKLFELVDVHVVLNIPMYTM